MSVKENLLTPVGRMVMGSLYEPQTQDAEGNPLVYRMGANAGQPKVDYFFALAILKGAEQHWAETSWGQKIWAVGHTSFPNGQAQKPNFAWKIINGDSAEPNSKGKRPCDREGYPQHWVLTFNSSFAPSIFNETGSAAIIEKNAVNLGDYIQVAGCVCSNESQQNPGIKLYHTHIAFSRYGQPIFTGVDPKSIGFGVGVVIPNGASLAPISRGFTPPQPVTQVSIAPPIPATPLSPMTVVPSQPLSPPNIQPYTQILSPQVMPAPKRMTAIAQGTYEQYVAMGWSDAQLIQHGLMDA